MYELAVTRDFVAQHYLTVPDPGAEGNVHSHRYAVELRFAGPTLDEYGYLVDIDAVNAALDSIEKRYRDATLNDLPEFEGTNPSVERFARLLGDRVENAISEPNPTQFLVRLWEGESAWASHHRSLDR
ncbi:6-carboxytetrahydropterin synthase [Halocatena pleomorpha]|uniref:6-carboxytetrahydropterin synthase n=2 Tax=Halocatena pleomorpha TaxID=1785090 RepID=A0A3P3RK26_9EURY|nr:6-carboxytetrahydropterin synthase [Halocatena pleomorpha]